jgi:hypothetical protein
VEVNAIAADRDGGLAAGAVEYAACGHRIRLLYIRGWIARGGKG